MAFLHFPSTTYVRVHGWLNRDTYKFVYLLDSMYLTLTMCSDGMHLHTIITKHVYTVITQN